MSPTTKGVAGLLAAIVLAYVILLLWLSPLPLEDYPNHLARAVVMTDLMFRHGATFAPTFQYRFLIAPYELGDWILAGLTYTLGVKIAGAVFALLVFLSLPCALFTYLRAIRVSLDTTLVMLLLSVYFSTDLFFLMGFLSFRLGVAFVLVALGVAEHLRRRWSAATFAALFGIVLLAYLTHLAAVIFLAVGLGATTAVRLWLRTARIRREMLLFVPVAGALAWQFLIVGAYRQPHDAVSAEFFWGTPTMKLRDLLWNLLRYYPRWDEILVACLAACLLVWVVSRGRLVKRMLMKPEVLEPFTVAVAFVCVYITLPSSYSDAYLVDVRALSLAWPFAVLAILNIPDRERLIMPLANALAVAFAVLLAVLNLLFIGQQLHSDARWLAQYRLVVSRIPEHSWVLPVYTGSKLGRVIRPSLHDASFAVIDRAALIPYLFSADAGHPMKYFRYADRPYAPDEQWYREPVEAPVDWPRISALYDYLLLMKPFDAARIPVAGRTVAENDAAALVSVR